LVITDLDNTLYDWVTSFVPAFYSMVDAACELLDVPKEQLLDEMQAVHRRYGNSEQPFALLETPIVACRFPNFDAEERRRHLDPVFHVFNKVRRNSLQLYDSVRETLQVIQQSGALTVAHTDAHVGNSLFRLSKLDLTELVARLYAPLKQSGTELICSSANGLHALRDYVHVLPPEDRKPNPKALLDICADYSVQPTRTLYIGDSLFRDIHMANQASVHSAWARYGTNYNPELWSKLVRITHWTDDDVATEAQLRVEAGDVHAEVDLNQFSDVLASFTFSRGANGDLPAQGIEPVSAVLPQSPDV